MREEYKDILQRRSVIDEVTGQLEVPNGNNPFQNAWLTLTLGYDLLFLDSRVHGTVTGTRFSGKIIVKHKDLGWCARDSDDFLFPILDWGYDSIMKFHKLFRQGEQIWNHKFLLQPPDTFDKLDYTSPALRGYVLRPNILCLFRMESGARHSRTFNVVRINPEIFEDPTYEVPNYSTKKTKRARDGFRSHEKLLTDRDVFTPALGLKLGAQGALGSAAKLQLGSVLGHELGHALNEEHILAIKGDTECKVDPNLDRCYGLTLEELRNIMGVGTEITRDNAGPWVDHLNQILRPDTVNCAIVMLTDPKVRPLPPRKIPVAPANKATLPLPPLASRRPQPVGAGRR